MRETEKNRNTYGGIFKALALFGGMKIIQIIISILRSKLIAVLIGPAGMGINNLLRSTRDTLNHVTGCGLHTSAVREVAKSYHEGDQEAINVTVTTLRGLVWFTGMIGAVLMIVFAEPLSQFAFGNKDYTMAFRILSVTMIILQHNTGQTVLMQGSFHYKDMARATLIGQILSLVLTIPLYYFFREKGIVPALVIAATVAMILTKIYSKRVHYQKVKLTFKEYWKNGKGMLSLGIVIAIGGQISNASSYLMNVIISRVGSLEAVGLYSAAMSIVNTYVFLVLSAMSTDYVPRLSAISGDDQEQTKVINKQMEMVLIIITPLLVVFSVFAKEAILILYSAEFYSVIHMLEFLMFGMFFRAISWCLSYAFIARGDSKIFLINECIMFFISLSLKYVGFYYGSYTGVGIAVIAIYIIYTLLMLLISKRRFGFVLSKTFFKISVPSFIFCSLALVVSVAGNVHWWKYVIGIIILGVSIWFAYTELDKRVHIKNALLARISKTKNE